MKWLSLVLLVGLVLCVVPVSASDAVNSTAIATQNGLVSGSFVLDLIKQLKDYNQPMFDMVKSIHHEDQETLRMIIKEEHQVIRGFNDKVKESDDGKDMVIDKKDEQQHQDGSMNTWVWILVIFGMLAMVAIVGLRS